MVVFSNTTSELAVQLSNEFPGDDVFTKVGYFMDNIMCKLPDIKQNIDVGSKNDIICLTGEWNDLTLVHQILEEWMLEDGRESSVKLEPGEVSYADELASSEVSVSNTPKRARGRPRKRHASNSASFCQSSQESTPQKISKLTIDPETSEIQSPPSPGEVCLAPLEAADNTAHGVNDEDESSIKLDTILVESGEEEEISFESTPDGKFACKECDFSSPRLLNLRQHYSRNHATKRYKCPVCPKKFGLKKACTEHFAWHHKEPQFQCNLCEKTFQKKYLLIAHVSTNHKKIDEKNVKEENDNLKCSECDFVAKKVKYLELHKERLHGEKKFSCDHCDKKYSVERDLKAHLKTHTEPHQCPYCEKMLKSKLALESHVKVLHEGKPNGRIQKNYLCVTCGKLCRNKTMYTIHMNKVHLNVKPFECAECGMQFYAKSNLTQHEMTHSDRREFKCKFCDKSFKQRQGLRIHMVIHNESRPYKCETCSKTFTQQGALIRHSRIHSGDRPYHCQFCEARFSDYSILRRHLLGIHKIDDPALIKQSIAKSREAAKEQPDKSATASETSTPAPRRGPGGKIKMIASVEQSSQPNKIDIGMPVVIMPEVLATPQKLSLPDVDTPQVGFMDAPQTIHIQPQVQQQHIEAQVPIDLGETVVTQMLPQNNQLFLNSSTLPGTVFIQQTDLQDSTIVPTSIDNQEQIFVMNQQIDVLPDDKSAEVMDKDTMIISQDALPPNVAMYEHEGQTYAFVIESAIPQTQ